MALNICVYCSSSNHVDARFFDVAEQVGTTIGRRGDTLVWGGGRIGLMGQLARAVHATGGKVVGVIPDALTDVEIAYHEADELIITKTMRERKHVMDERSDAFVILPGGFGTLEELSEILVLKLLRYHDRPVVILNAFRFYDPLVELFDHFIEHGFAKVKHRELYDVVTTPDEAFALIDQRA